MQSMEGTLRVCCPSTSMTWTVLVVRTVCGSVLTMELRDTHATITEMPLLLVKKVNCCSLKLTSIFKHYYIVLCSVKYHVTSKPTIYGNQVCFHHLLHFLCSFHSACYQLHTWRNKSEQCIQRWWAWGSWRKTRYLLQQRMVCHLFWISLAEFWFEKWKGGVSHARIYYIRYRNPTASLVPILYVELFSITVDMI